MRKISSLWIALALGIVVAGAALAAPASAPTVLASPAAIQAIVAPAPAAAGLPPGAQPATFSCPVNPNWCVTAQCYCTDQCIPQHVPGTLTSCFPSTHTYTCSCQLN